MATAREISSEQVAVRVVLPGTEGAATKLKESWERWNPQVPLELIPTQYQSISKPIKAFVKSKLDGYDMVVLLIPVVEPKKLRHRILHNQLNLVLSSAFISEPRVIVLRILQVVGEESYQTHVSQVGLSSLG
ncbi:hypothetical protein SAMN02745225_02269 [Ferrithrix thermotolerans DSM 19514]|uniref:Uncharacterized protein n=1 Tax=Ferrithrix thermotolerans DSM 19514 TaxID=1121881 RepID=A0A1M4Y804_9ACTN|nr:hypothetical protein [Ferrithrix thermotolerans]SHF01799.1 hypothetical protein SAMN02745225_02269 [Ferrithrix thermotolerans DSM 19514]